MWKPNELTDIVDIEGDDPDCNCSYCQDIRANREANPGQLEKLKALQPTSLEEKIARLETFRDGLMTVPNENFHMDSWINGKPEKLLEWPEAKCGTTGCAVGWLPAIVPSVFTSKKTDPKTRSKFHDVIFKGITEVEVSNEDAAQVYFDLSHDEAQDLFYPYHYTDSTNCNNGDFECFPSRTKLTPQHVATRMSYMIDQYKKELCQQKREGSAPSA